MFPFPSLPTASQYPPPPHPHRVLLPSRSTSDISTCWSHPGLPSPTLFPGNPPTRETLQTPIPELMKQGQLLPLFFLTSHPSPSLSRLGLVPRVLEGTAGKVLRNRARSGHSGRGRRSTFGCFLGHLELGWKGWVEQARGAGRMLGL